MKKIYLLDTNIVSEFSKESPNEQVVGLYNLRRDQCAISSVTWQELVFGFSRMPEGRKKDYIRSCLDLYKRDLEIIPYDEFAASICGEVQSNAEQAGKKIPYNDSQIAATAISNGMVLVTHNTEDFSYMTEKTFLKMEDWFAA